MGNSTSGDHRKRIKEASDATNRIGRLLRRNFSQPELERQLLQKCVMHAWGPTAVYHIIKVDLEALYGVDAFDQQKSNVTTILQKVARAKELTKNAISHAKKFDMTYLDARHSIMTLDLACEAKHGRQMQSDLRKFLKGIRCIIGLLKKRHKSLDLTRSKEAIEMLKPVLGQIKKMIKDVDNLRVNLEAQIVEVGSNRQFVCMTRNGIEKLKFTSLELESASIDFKKFIDSLQKPPSDDALKKITQKRKSLSRSEIFRRTSSTLGLRLVSNSTFHRPQQMGVHNFRTKLASSIAKQTNTLGDGISDMSKSKLHKRISHKDTNDGDRSPGTPRGSIKAMKSYASANHRFIKKKKLSKKNKSSKAKFRNHIRSRSSLNRTTM